MFCVEGYDDMVSPWWGLGIAVPAVAIRALTGDGKHKREDEPLSRCEKNYYKHQNAPNFRFFLVPFALMITCTARTCRADEGTEPSFVCERVCTSDRLMRRMGGLSKVRGKPSSSRSLWIGPQYLFSELQTIHNCSWLLHGSPIVQEATPNTCVTVCGVSGTVQYSLSVFHFPRPPL